ncbi:class I SAM-dependent methyltransferase [candidate division KSB1 bacterium]|nr:class I SAM-dependent methyltransferase [candidate division KSB1 bacterium]MBL7094260.1 class I SAM-dependent methyltransferase [candidate division KSB1 bacterium]
MKLFPRLSRFGKTAGFNRPAYRDYQREIGDFYLENYVRPLAKGKTILDIGCAEGGVLEAFKNDGFECTGLEYSEHRFNYAQETGSKEIKFIQGDIEEKKFKSKFDVILMLDVFEHLEKKGEAMENIKQALLPGGICVISFPPFRSAFGGHQQVMSSFLQFIPFLHLLPEKTYRWLLEHIEKKNVESFLRICQTGITIRQFEKQIAQAGFEIKRKIFHFVRPRQAFRFGIKIKEYKSNFLREYFATGAIYILT